MSKIGRNDPCPCGSGKKYKRCCLYKSIKPVDFTREHRQFALGVMARFVEEKLPLEIAKSHADFYHKWRDRLEELEYDMVEISNDVWEMWSFLDYRLSDGESAIERFLKHHAADLDPAVRWYLTLLRDTAMHLYEVADLSPGVSVTLRDVLDNRRITVREKQGSRSLWKHALVAARVIARGPSGHPEMESGLLNIPDFVREQMISQLSAHYETYCSEHRGPNMTDFFKEMALFFHDAWISGILEPHMPAMQNTDGEEIVPTVSRFDILESKGLEAAFDAEKKLERTEQDQLEWLWTERDKRGKSVIMGNLVINGKRLELVCNSARRDRRGRKLVERIADGKVRHLSTTHENMEMAIRERMLSNLSNEDSATAHELPRELNEALVLEHQGKYYRQWLDEKIPALNHRTPREAAANVALFPKLLDLIGGLESFYQRCLKDGEPAYDPSWMYGELGIEDPFDVSYPPPLAHERMASMTPGLGDLCKTVAKHLRRQPDFDDASTLLTTDAIGANMEIQRFLRSEQSKNALKGEDSLSRHIVYMTNFELHLRKTFWVDKSLVFMLAKTDLEVPGGDLRMPFGCFALAFTDRHTLSLGERFLSTTSRCPISGHYLKTVTVYVTEKNSGQTRELCLTFAFDALGADPPHLFRRHIELHETAPIKLLPDETPQQYEIEGVDIQEMNPLRGLLHVAVSAILYATSAGAEPQTRRRPFDARSGALSPVPEPVVFSGEEVFFLPGAIEISRLSHFQELDRIPSGRTILHRFMVRGHWRRAASNWKDQRMRWIAPFWKGPDIATIIERAYKLKP